MQSKDLSIKIYYKIHNIQNIDATSDWDRSHLPIFYAKNCDIYTSAFSYDTNPDITKNNGDTWTFIDPSTCLPSAPLASSINLLTSFTCSYACIAPEAFTDAETSLVGKIGMRPDTVLNIVEHGFFTDPIQATGTPTGNKCGCHYTYLQSSIGQSFVYGHYEQLGNAVELQLTLATQQVKRIAEYAASKNAPFVIIIKSNSNIVALANELKSELPQYFRYPKNLIYTNVSQSSPTLLTASNNIAIVTAGIDIDIENIPPQTPIVYAHDEQNALILTLKNIQKATHTEAVGTSVQNFNLEPKTVTLNIVV